MSTGDMQLILCLLCLLLARSSESRAAAGAYNVLSIIFGVSALLTNIGEMLS